MSISIRSLPALLTTALLSTFLGTGVSSLLDKRTELPELLCQLAGLIMALVIFVLAARRLARAGAATNARVDRTQAWMITLIGYSILLKLLYLDLLDLIPEEAYYWVYAQHPALSYLDHPPLVAWGITAGTAIFGNTEFGVRIFTLLCWFVTLGFLASLTNHAFGAKTRLSVLLLGCLLPYPFLFGFFATPDAPLMAAWVGALYFLQRALWRERAGAWWGFGICMGVGMLSKYSMGLVGLAALLIVLLDKRNHHWLRRPQPYLAVVVALVIFTPVLYWNQQHDWASFGFQSARRLRERSEFKLPELLLFILALVTPMGVAATLRAMRHGEDWASDEEPDPGSTRRRRLLFLVATLVPLSVFLWFSLSHRTKFSWTGPLWLALLPVWASQLTRSPDTALLGWHRLRPRLWIPMTALLGLFYGGGFQYMSQGFPFIPYPRETVQPVAWEEFGKKLNEILTDLESLEGQEPILIGLDRHFVASETSFYRGGDAKALRTTRTERVYGGNGTMYQYWFPELPKKGRLMLLVSFHLDQLENERIHQHFEEVGPILKDQVYKRGKPAGRFFYRVGKGYLPTGKPGR